MEKNQRSCYCCGRVNHYGQMKLLRMNSFDVQKVYVCRNEKKCLEISDAYFDNLPEGLGKELAKYIL